MQVTNLTASNDQWLDGNESRCPREGVNSCHLTKNLSVLRCHCQIATVRVQMEGEHLLTSCCMIGTINGSAIHKITLEFDKVVREEHKHHAFRTDLESFRASASFFELHGISAYDSQYRVQRTGRKE